MDAFFKISRRNSTVGTEVIGGLTTFLTMAYIIAVNPAMLSQAGIPFSAALTATCFGAAAASIAMGLIANRPLALASGMGINAVVAFTLCLGMQLDWRVAMSIIFLEGILILILVLCGLREAVMCAIPVGLRHAIGIGIGLFIALIGLEGAGIVSADPSTLITMGDLAAPGAIVGIIAIVAAVVLTALNVKGGILISIVAATICGIPLGVTVLPTEFNFGLDFSTLGAPLQNIEGGGMAIIQVFMQPILLLFVFSLLMSDFFDTMGTIVAVGQKGGFVDKDGNVENVREILLVDSGAAALGGLIGASSITTYVESTAGAAEGSKTGLSSVLVGILFILFAFLAPIIGMVSSAATCGALVVVGYLMMSEIGTIDWKDITQAFPAFITILGIPLTYSITNGIGLGFISYVLIMAVTGKAKNVKPLMWVASVAFLAVFIFT
ncbi:MAG: NCS2 family permease [Coriobacteriales bacterium]|jgi:AGZA family xanthine/uracil permease-like MFS transporter|nr:NCS2 family permease [Coriobacteriales bacterium]